MQKQIHNVIPNTFFKFSQKVRGVLNIWGACYTRPLACKSKYTLMFSVMELHPLTIVLLGGKLRPSQWRLLFRIWIPTVFKIIAVTVKVFLTITKMKN